MRNFTETLLCSPWCWEIIFSKYTAIAQMHSYNIQAESLYSQAFPRII